jgi:hypothetical protein
MTAEDAPKSRLETARMIISHASQSIEKEYGRTGNPWLSCFGSVIFQLETNLATQSAREELGDDVFTRVNEKLVALKNRLAVLKEEPNSDTTGPSEEVREELLQALNIID